MGCPGLQRKCLRPGRGDLCDEPFLTKRQRQKNRPNSAKPEVRSETRTSAEEGTKCVVERHGRVVSHNNTTQENRDPAKRREEACLLLVRRPELSKPPVTAGARLPALCRQQPSRQSWTGAESLCFK